MNRQCQFRLQDGYTPCPADRRAGSVEVAPGKRLHACQAHLAMKKTQGSPVFPSDSSHEILESNQFVGKAKTLEYWERHQASTIFAGPGNSYIVSSLGTLPGDVHLHQGWTIMSPAELRNDPHGEQCSNCGRSLTQEAVRLAVKDAGMAQKDLTFCCASYDAAGRCTGEHTDEDMAYWYS